VSVNEYDSGKPVALLARAGMAREKLRAGVSNAGGHIVLEEEPDALDAQVLLEAAPQVVLVALEPAVEDALERLDAVLQSPGMMLIFEEADVAARREGWEEQRWVRHLSAKLNGHDNVLPPTGEAAVASDDRQVPAPAFVMEMEDVPEAYQPPLPAVEAIDSEPVPSWDDLMALSATPPEETPEADSAPAVDAEAHLPRTQSSGPPPLPVQESPVYQTPDFSSWALVTDDELSAQPAPVEVQATQPSTFLSGALALMDLEPEAGDEDEQHGEPLAPAARLALVLAGIGGPDAVRRVLAELPVPFAPAVLVQMRLDGGRYDNLVRQMSRVTELPVVLAELDKPVHAGHVYILADDVGIASSGQGWLFAAAGQTSLVASLPAADAVLLMLSGADVEAVPAALEFAGNGGYVAGQAGSGCYAPEAANQLAAAGMTSGTAEELAQALISRWGG
jgi:chemosensory pili system protein ChpB (putative protein-glutamate methylesterase)